jgi:anthranilate synthase
VLSPGPGRPEDFGISKTLDVAHDLRLPTFGVCLGLQGMAEYCGARLALMPVPQHGKSATVRVHGGKLFDALPEQFKVGRYHSIHVPRDTMPDALSVTAETEDGIVMAIEHRALPWAGVQFHPESIMTLDDGTGQRIIDTVMRVLAR